MNIEILHLIEGAKKASGLTVIIDVFRAFSVACYLFDNGAEKIIPVGDIDIAYRLKEENPDFILIGERNARIQPGFDYGNSPTHIQHIDFSGKTIVQTTSAGTQGIVNARNADEIITGSLVNADAIVRYIRQQNPKDVSLVCMGYEGKTESDEDTFCAGYIKNTLEGKHFRTDNAVELLKDTGGKRFFDPANSEWAPESDFYLCLAPNRFNFVLRLYKDPSGIHFLKRIDI
jgi:2-phosphosulfolactate phosphatase